MRRGDICPNHVIGYPDPNVLVCRRLAILPVEIVVRDYLTGTDWDIDLADVPGGPPRTLWYPPPLGAARKPRKLPATIITPTTKAVDGGHDEPITPDENRRQGLLDPGAMAHDRGVGARVVSPRLARVRGAARV